MSTQTIDYDALAAQHGGAVAVDYDALAAQHGATNVKAEAAPNAGLAPPAGAPPKTLDSGEGPIARGMTSFETQLSKLPEGIVRTIGAKHWPIIDAQNFHELGEDIKSLNPIVKNDTGANGGIDIGATAANVLPLAIDAEGGGIAESPIGKSAATAIEKSAPAVRAAARGANTALAKYPKAVGTTVGGAIGAASRIPYGTEVGAGIGGMVGPEILPKIHIPGEGFGLPDRVTGGPKILPPLSEGEILRDRLDAVAPQSAIDNLRNQPIPPEVSYTPERPSIERILDAAPTASAPTATPGAAGSMARSIQTPIEATPAPKATLSSLEKQINDALGGKPLEKGVPLRNQTKPLTNLQKQIADSAEPSKAAPRAPLTNLQEQIAHPLPEGFTPVKSQVLAGYKYDPAKQEFTAVTNAGQRYTHAEVTPDEFKKFEDAESKGTAWNKQIRANHVQVEKNGQPTKPIAPRKGGPAAPILSPIESGPAPAPKTARAASAVASPEDLTSQLEKSRDAALAKGVSTTVNPARLAKRWGVDENSIADTDANVRNLNAQQSKAYIDKLAKAYREGKPVEPVIETRDAENNLISVDGRHRALAAQKAGVGRIPIIVRRTGVQ